MKPGIFNNIKEAKWIILMAVVLWLVIVGIAKADRLVNINLVVVNHPTSASPEDQIRLFTEGISRLPEVKVKSRIIKIEIVPDFYNVNTLNELYSRLFTWAEYGKKQNFKGVVFYSLPPMTNNAGSFYSAGHAGAICVFTRNKRLKFAEGVLLTQNRGLDREPHARIVALHEMLHLLGANHIDAVKGKQYCNIMHPAAQACVNQVPILPLTIKQVRWCKQGKNVLGKKYV